MRHTDGHAYGDCYLYANTDCHGNGYVYANGNSDVYSDRDCYGNRDGDSDRNAAAHADAKAASHASASPVRLSGGLDSWNSRAILASPLFSVNLLVEILRAALDSRKLSELECNASS